MPTDLERRIAPFLASSPAPTLTGVLERAAYIHGLTLERLRAPSQAAPLVRARQFAMSEARDAGYSLPEIGAALNRHHTTVLHGVRVHRRRE